MVAKEKKEEAHGHKHPTAQVDYVIDFRDVTKTYKLGVTTVEALRGINLSVERGDSISIMGPSGSGKSTLLHIMGCLDVPTSGKYYLDGLDVATLGSDDLARTRGKKIGFVFQFFHLIPSLNAIENVILPMMFDSIGEEERWKKAEALLDKVGLKSRMYHKPNELSGGERQRVAIARALSQNPTVLLADEPTGNLDSAVGAEIIKLFHKLHHEEGITLVTVTHDPQIAHYADRVIFIKDGLIEKITKGTEHERMVEMLKKEISFEQATGLGAGEEEKLLKVLEKDGKNGKKPEGAKKKR